MNLNRCLSMSRGLGSAPFDCFQVLRAHFSALMGWLVLDSSYLDLCTTVLYLEQTYFGQVALAQTPCNDGIGRLRLEGSEMGL